MGLPTQNLQLLGLEEGRGKVGQAMEEVGSVVEEVGKGGKGGVKSKGVK